ncbi:hypothetical protein MMC25_001433 [Agyrium rufum]|nr:hypothetical protein [Agyrium rufum]
MATIASPRPSVTSFAGAGGSADSSRRTSIDTVTTSGSRPESLSRAAALGVGAPPAGHARRNRAALRDYYNIKPSGAGSTDASSVHSSDQHGHNDQDAESTLAGTKEKESELDRPGFDAETYVKDLLATSGLEGVMKVEAGLINEIKGLDGERKALVYDNYSKLITATDTIRKMRTNMEPLTPMTAGLGPVVAGIVRSAEGLLVKPAGIERAELGAGEVSKKSGKEVALPEIRTGERNAIKAQTVKWVLDTPSRMKRALADGGRNEAVRDWEEICIILEKWKDTIGVAELRQTCQNILKDEDDE